MRLTFTILYCLIFFSSTNSFSAISEFVKSANDASQIRILGSYQQKGTDSSLIAAIEFDIKKGWKIYAPDNKSGSSEFGQPPVFDFSRSQNLKFDSVNIIWPEALKEKEQIGNQVINYSIYKNNVLIPIELKEQNKNQPINLKVNIDYALCKNICIPVSQKLNLTIKTLEKDNNALQIINNLQPAKKKNDHSSDITLFKALIIAFIGGLILNIMPCVLPVISIKILSIINHSGTSIGKIRTAYFATISGIVFCFTLFAAITAILKLLGSSLGWGFQFQNPYFLIFLIVVLMIFIANLLDVFELHSFNFINSFLDKKINDEQRKHHIFIPNFLSGILAVLLATPCSAPFLGTAISFALSQNIIKIFAAFIAMALGLAFPYIILIIFPHATNLLPKPGSWMVKVKNLMAGFLAATAIWLVWVLSNNIGFIPAMIVALFALLILALFKIGNKFKLHSLSRILLFSTLIYCSFIIPDKTSDYFAAKAKEYNQLWIKFDQKQIPKLVKEGKVVIVDITADWCITCKLNKALVLNSKQIVSKIKSGGVIAMRGDLTIMDEDIMNFIRSYNRYAIPFNIVYGPRAPQGILTSELLSKEKLLKIINQAKSIH